MSFSMNCIKVKHTTVRDKIIACHQYVNNSNILTTNVKYALNKYVDFRFTKRQNKNFTAKRLSELVEDLLQYCCDESIDNITIDYVEANEGSILYELKRAIYYGATKCLYNIELQNTCNTISNDLDKTPKYFNKLTNNQLKNKRVVEEYFEEVI